MRERDGKDRLEVRRSRSASELGSFFLGILGGSRIYDRRREEDTRLVVVAAAATTAAAVTAATATVAATAAAAAGAGAGAAAVAVATIVAAVTAIATDAVAASSSVAIKIPWWCYSRGGTSDQPLSWRSAVIRGYVVYRHRGMSRDKGEERWYAFLKIRDL